jgi:hypothetical protein
MKRGNCVAHLEVDAIAATLTTGGAMALAGWCGRILVAAECSAPACTAYPLGCLAICLTISLELRTLNSV